MKIVLILLLTLFSQLIHAQNNIPTNCKLLEIKKPSLEFAAKKSMLFLIYNKSNQDVWLIRPSTGEGVKAGYDSQLQSKKWSALAVYEKALTFHCMKSMENSLQSIEQLPCAHFLTIMQCPKARLLEKIDATYWVQENKDLSKILGRVF